MKAQNNHPQGAGLVAKVAYRTRSDPQKEITATSAAGVKMQGKMLRMVVQTINRMEDKK